ncbi:unnamed protein product [Rhodiola kirilowii]
MMESVDGIQVLEFDDSADNHLQAVQTIFRICGEPDIDHFYKDEIKRVGSSITFLRHWRDYTYKPRAVNFSPETKRSHSGYATNEIILPQYSVAALPKDTHSTSTTSKSPKSSTDFILYCGGPIWGLDWCPQVRPDSGYYANCEFLAVAAHPPGSSYHKLGIPLRGRGVVQIWCCVNVKSNEGMEELSIEKSHCKGRGRPNKILGGSEDALLIRPVGRPKKESTNKSSDQKTPKARGRPRKEPVSDIMNGTCGHNELIMYHSTKESTEKSSVQKTPKQRGRPRKEPVSDIMNGTGGHNELTLHHSAKESKEKSSVQKTPKQRGRPRKKPASEITNGTGEHNELIRYHSAKDAYFGGKSTFTDSLTRSAKNELPKSKKQMRNQNKMLPESINALCTSDSLNLVDNDDCNQALVQYFTEQSPQPVTLYEVPVEQSTSTNSMGKTPTTLQSSDIVSVDEFMPKRAINFSDDDSGVSLPLKRARDRSTQPIRTYVRRHKVAKTVQYNETVKACSSKPEQSMTHFDNTDCTMRYDLETDVHETQVRQQKYASEELPASCSVFQHEKEYHFAGANRTELSGEDATNMGPCTQDTKYLSTTTVDLGPLPLCNAISGEQVENFPTDLIIPQDIAAPRLILCLAHNGKVAWDVKWRPIAHVSHCKLRMGYLAVVLGNGSLEVWDVPLPNIVCDVFSSSRTEGTDPRFIKLKPVFKCSKLKFGGRESIPLTVEWSASFPHDLLLAGCHDGMVAVWKFSEGNPCEDTRPLLCFRADTTPIRAVSWAPAEKDGEDAKVIVTAGHTGLKFWDLRDPFHPLWTLPLLRVYSLDWMPNPRCVVISSDDGSLKLLSISQASDDTSVTGKPFPGSKLQGLHTYNCSMSAIWSIHISRVTGMAAYCSADGTVVRFQLTTKAVEKDHSRNRVPHFLFWSLTGNDSVLTVNTPPSNTPAELKKPNYGPQSMRALVGLCNQPQTNYLQLKAPPSDNQTLAL